MAIALDSATNKSSQLKRTLLISLEKDLSNSKVDIKVYCSKMESLPGLVKM